MFGTDDMEAQGDPIAILKATSDPNTMYMHEAMGEPDCQAMGTNLVIWVLSSLPDSSRV